MLYQIDDLQIAVETAKRLLMKEKIDKQKTGHSSVSPFMKFNQENSKKNEKGVNFSAVDTMKRHSDNIDKLTSLVNKLDMKLDGREAQYRPKIFQGRNRGCRQRQHRYRSRDGSHSRECGQHNNNSRGRRNYDNGNYSDRNYRSNYGDNSRSRNRGRNNRYDNRSNYRRDNYRQNYGNQGYRNRNVS